MREAAELLEEQGTLERIRQPAKRRPEADFLKLTKKVDLTIPGSEEEDFLTAVSGQVRYLNGDELTKVAKATKPYLESSTRQFINLDDYLETLKKKHARLVRPPKVAALVAEAKSE